MVTLRVNGQDRSFDGDPAMPLLWYLRDELGLTGTKYGCGQALCGACTVHLDGEATRSCAVTMGDLAGRNVATIEGLEDRSDHAGRRAACRQAESVRCGDHRRDDRQYLPLRLLSAHSRRHQARRDRSVT